MSNDFDELAADLTGAAEIITKKAGQVVEYSAFATRKQWKKDTRVPKGQKKADFAYDVTRGDEPTAVIEGTTRDSIRDSPDMSYRKAERTAATELERGMQIAIDQTLAEFGL